MWFGNSINQRRAQRRALLHATLVQIRPKKTQPALTALRMFWKVYAYRYYICGRHDEGLDITSVVDMMKGLAH